MSDLRVTDVQAALRHFASIGHDVLTDPRAVHLTNHPDEKPQAYRMAAGHSLSFDGKGMQIGGLTSYIMQSERPLISYVATHIQTDWRARRVAPLVPTMQRERMMGLGLDLKEDDKYHHFTWDTTHNSSSGPGYHDSMTGLKGSSVFHTDGPSDIHEALKAHTTKAVSHTGARYLSEERKQPMTPEEMSNFDVPHAMLSMLEGAQPFKGLITVRQGLGNIYHYNPDTEELRTHLVRP
jgi:hypothetical protein